MVPKDKIPLLADEEIECSPKSIRDTVANFHSHKIKQMFKEISHRAEKEGILEFEFIFETSEEAAAIIESMIEIHRIRAFKIEKKQYMLNLCFCRWNPPPLIRRLFASPRQIAIEEERAIVVAFYK